MAETALKPETKPAGPTLDERVAELEAEVKSLRAALRKSDKAAAEVREAVAPRLVARGIKP